MTSISQTIRDRVTAANAPFFANDNISNFIHEGELLLLQEELELKFEDVLQSMIIDTSNDHNTKETAKRAAKMYLNEIFKGRYLPIPTFTDFPNAKNLDEMYMLGPIQVNSTCSHHLLPVIGKVWVGVLAGDRVLGISKFSRIADWIMSRPHIQEEAVIMLADELERILKPNGIAIYMEAAHLCMRVRGVKEAETEMTNIVVRGEFRTNPSLKYEFLNSIKH